MASGLLSLKWNNHRSTFFHVLSNIRSKESYCDVTLACDGRFYSLHKFVLSTCSEYFEEMFERTQCKHPVIVLKDINSEDLEALLNYMYVGEVNVVQEKLAGLIKAAECLKIKGLAVPDEDPMESKDNSSIDRERHKRSQRGEDSPRAKRRRRENSSDVSEEILSPVRSRPSARNREYHSSQNSKSAPVAPSEENEEGSREMHGLTDASEEAENSSINANRRIEGHNKTKLSSQLKSKREPEQVNLEEEEEEQEVKAEPREEEEDEGAVGGQDGGEGMEELESKASLHEQLGLDVQDATDDGYSNAAMMEGQLDGSAGASGYHENSFLWEGEGSLSAFPGDGFSGDSSSQSRQMFGGGHDLSYFTPSSSAVPTWASETQYVPPVLAERSPKLGAVGRAGVFNPAVLAARADGFKRNDSTELKAFVCTFCSYQTNIKTNFRVHLRTHTGEKPYKCPYCPYRSSHKSNLKPHMMRHQTQHRGNSNFGAETESNLCVNPTTSKLSSIGNLSQNISSVLSMSPTSSIAVAGPLTSSEGSRQLSIGAVSSIIAAGSSMSTDEALMSSGAPAVEFSSADSGPCQAPLEPDSH